jgi:16S rRNA (guanine527-N7)-methyltransferase
VLEAARELGFVGPGDPQHHIDHAETFAVAAETRFGTSGPDSFLDLGSGAGVPGLILAMRWSTSRAVLVDASERRCTFARDAAQTLGCESRVAVRCERAEVLGQDPELREAIPLVVARSCAAPAVTAEWATPFIRPGGFLVVSEPPATSLSERWPTEALARLGYGAAQYERTDQAGVAVIEKVVATPPGYPRRVGVAAKRPRW